MRIRFLAAGVAFALLACGVAEAAPTTVQLRVEGAAATLFEGPVTTDGHAIDKGDGPHPCDGTNGGANPSPGPTMTSALDDWSRSGGLPWQGTWFSGFDDFGIDRIGPDAADATHFWGYALNFVPSQIGGCQQQVRAGDEVLFGYDFFSKAHLLRLDGPPRAATGRQFDVTVTDGQSGAPLDGAMVTGAASPTGPDGRTSVTVGAPGVVTLKAERADSLRSNGLRVCVSETGTGDCGLPPAALGAPGGRAVKDSVAPRARITSPRDGRRYRRGPRLLKGTAADDVGVTRVKLALRRHVRGKPCRWWSGTRERFTGRGCARKVFFSIGSSTDWSYLLPRRLGRGRYVLDVKALDRTRNRDERFVRGSNRVVFYVGRRARTRAAAAPRGRGFRVTTALVGPTSNRVAAVRARETLVRVGRRKCRVPAATPLAALAALLRKVGTGYRLRDYGSCSRRTASASGQLFVRRIGGDANRGNDGWFYKVNDRAPEIGAADPASRLRRNDRLLWFYCVFDEAARSCQRSLRIVPTSGSTSGSLRVTVRGYDNAGHWTPVAGAAVATAELKALTGPDGTATFSLGPGSGRYVVTASKGGMVDAFPVTVRVG